MLRLSVEARLHVATVADDVGGLEDTGDNHAPRAAASTASRLSRFTPRAEDGILTASWTRGCRRSDRGSAPWWSGKVTEADVSALGGGATPGRRNAWTCR